MRPDPWESRIMWPHQGVASLIIALTSVVIVLSLFFYSTRHEGKHQSDSQDKH